MSKLFRKSQYDEYYINSSRMERLYNLYFRKHLGDAVLDWMVIFAIFATLLSIAMKYVITISWGVLVAINSISVFVFFIFGLELMRDYIQVKSKKQFFRKHWLDFILISFLTVHFLLFYVIGFLNFFIVSIFAYLKPFFVDVKEVRVIYNIFKKE